MSSGRTGGSDAGTSPPEPHTDWFSTDDVRRNLGTRSVRSGLVNLGSQGTQVLLGIAATMVLARLLTPSDFGLYAMTGTLIAFVGSFRDFGLSTAAVQRDALDHREYSALFWVYQRINVFTAVFMIAMAPVLVWFFDRSELLAMTAVMAVGIFTLNLAVQQEALLKRQMRFGALTGIDVSGTVLGAVAGVGAALLGLEYWALVVQFMVLCLTKTLGCWLVSGWRPAGPGRDRSTAIPGVGQLLSYGKDVTAASVVRHLGRNLDRLLIGSLAGAQTLGLYHHADKWAHFPVKQVQSPLRNVVITGLSRLQHEPERYLTYVRRALLPIFSITLPAVAFLFVEAERVLLFLLGPQWLGAVPLFRILCVAAFFGKLNTVTKWLQLASGETRRQLRWDVISTPAMVAGVAVGILWGAPGVATGYTLATCALLVPGVVYCLNRTPVRPIQFAGIVWRPALAAIAAAAALVLLAPSAIGGDRPLLLLPLHLLGFGAAYVIVWLALPGGIRAGREILRLADALPWRRPAVASPVAARGE